MVGCLWQPNSIDRCVYGVRTADRQHPLLVARTYCMVVMPICTKRDYQKDGETKTKWYKVGILKVADSQKMYIKMFHQPETEFFVFDAEESPKGTEQDS